MTDTWRRLFRVGCAIVLAIPVLLLAAVVLVNPPVTGTVQNWVLPGTESRSLDQLDPSFQKPLQAALRGLAADGWWVWVRATSRDAQRQHVYLWFGNSKTMHSKHLTGHAADINPTTIGLCYNHPTRSAVLVPLLAASPAFAAPSCDDAVVTFAAATCLSPLQSIESDEGTGPTVQYGCTVDPDFGIEVVAVWSLSTDFVDFTDTADLDCAGGSLWIAPMSYQPFDLGVNASTMAWSLYHGFDDEDRTPLEDWLLVDSIVGTYLRMERD
jgi:hypothetical protein